ncbi:MAG: hypothetical protein HY788_23715 [Deltaproteobacteria bacterium]|nr:hypothetical protein [Deltaproteobacteria bacterium]
MAAKWLSHGFLPQIHSVSLEIVTIFSVVGSKKGDGLPILCTQSIIVFGSLSVLDTAPAEAGFPDIRINQEEHGFTGSHAVRLLPIQSVSSVSLEGAVLKPRMDKCQSEAAAFPPTFCSPLLMRLSPSNRTDHLAGVHNDLLSRIRKGLRFIGEVDKGIQEFELLCEELRSWVRAYGPRAATKRIWAEYPGAAACFVSLAGAYGYTHGEYWGFALRVIGIPCTPQYQRDCGQQFLWFILAFGLNPSHEVGLHYIGPILCHAMLPNDCLPEVFGQLLEPAVRSPSWTGLSAEDLIPAWLSQPTRFVGVDKPVWQFLKRGGQVARQILSEAIRMVRKRFETGTIPQASDLGLPQRIVQCYEIWLNQHNDPPPPRSPCLKLDPYSGILLAFPEQKLPIDSGGQICSWEVSACGQRLRGPSDYAQRRGEEAVFAAHEIPASPDGPYQIQLVVDKETIASWSINAMCIQKPWKFFSGRNCKELDVSRSLRAEPTWIVIPPNCAVIVRDFRDTALPDVEIQLCHLTGEWMGYRAKEIDLSGASVIELSCGNCADVLKVDQPEGEVAFSGGDLLQNTETSADNTVLFGSTPPHLAVRTKLGEEINSLENVRMRIAGCGIRGVLTIELTPADLSSSSQSGVGEIVIDLRDLIPPELCPGYLAIILWHREKRVANFRFRWVPDLKWEWQQDGRAVAIYLPEGVTLSESLSSILSGPPEPANGFQVIPIPEGRHDVELVLTWHSRGFPPLSVPLRLDGPRWAFLRRPSDTPVWQVTPIEMISDNLIEEDSPCVLFEMRDMTWREAELQAQWIGCGQENTIVDLGAEQLARKDRWLIRLATINDTLRMFQNTDSHITVAGTTSASCEVRNVQICIMHLLAPTIFRWAIIFGGNSTVDWSEVCIDVDMENLIEGDSPHVVFEARGERWMDAEVRVFWRVLDQSVPSKPLSANACAEPGRWHIPIEPVVTFAEECGKLDSEVWLEAKAPSLQGGSKTDMALVRAHRHPAKLLTYEDCKRWAEGNSLRTLALDLLCDLHYKYWFSVDLLATDWKKPQELIRRALHTVRIECPDITVTERQNTFAMSRETYRRVYPVLNEWDTHRRWIE